MSDVSDYSDDGDDIKQVAERDVYYRAGQTDPFDSMFERPIPADENERKKWMRGLTKKERFFYELKVRVVPECSELFDTTIDRALIVEKSKNIPGLGYKNPWGFILGFISSKGGREVSRTGLENTFEKLPVHIKDNIGITTADILRYSRYWVNVIR